MKFVQLDEVEEDLWGKVAMRLKQPGSEDTCIVYRRALRYGAYGVTLRKRLG